MYAVDLCESSITDDEENTTADDGFQKLECSIFTLVSRGKERKALSYFIVLTGLLLLYLALLHDRGVNPFANSYS